MSIFKKNQNALDNHTFSLIISDMTYQKIDAIAKLHRQTKSEIVRILLDTYLI
jgi:hypothetical protein